ncbi:MAG: penicillin-binding protein 2 [Flavobacteriaceae bacterium]|nr:penicillin-binding protein 2 [Flavobacteriaceae bacterium]
MKRRSLLIYFFVISIGFIYITRLFYLQIISDKYKKQAIENSIKKKYSYPNRGYVFDRNGILLVANEISYDVMLTPRYLKKIDTLEFCKLINITKRNFDKRLQRAKRYSMRTPSVFLKQLSKNDYAILQEKMHNFKGFYIQKRAIRNYPINTAANVLGYISEVSEQLLKKEKYYQQGELIGFSGIEKQYEKVLRGVKGVKRYQKDNFNRIIGSYKNGSQDTLAQIGKDLTLTLDIILQQYGEKLMNNKRGGIVAIEPSTGEILALITAPSYDPNNMVGRKRSKFSTKYINDKINKPMFDRGLKAQYAPGSPFKIVNALVGLQENVITTDSKFICRHGYRYGKRQGAFMKCHCGISGKVNFNIAIYNSCNSYFSNVYRKTIEKYKSPNKGMDVWSDHVKSFGLGNYLGTDLPVGNKGLIPDGDYYNKFYSTFRWRASTTISNAIGQGQVETTPIQLANVTAAVANRGFYFTPHIVKKIKDIKLDSKFTTPIKTSIDVKHFEPVIEGMFDVFEKGTARSSKVKGIEICGKTGTVENFVRINNEKVALADHSIFIAFAPKDNPKIAIAVFIENAGFGSTYAAPIASLMIEKYLHREIKRKNIEERMFNASLQEEYDKQIINTKQIEKP